MSPIVFTVGYSTRTLVAFIALLQVHAVTQVVDVRTVPRSRHNPQFNRETLPQSLSTADINYVHMAGLGGLRHPRPDSPNTAWRNASFRGFADYMVTVEFETNLEALLELTSRNQTVIMCAEAVPWRCHRLLIADALLLRSVHVEHILSGTRCQTHSLTPWAKIEGRRLTYPSEIGGTNDEVDIPLTHPNTLQR